MKKNAAVWIVEMWFDDYGWCPTAGHCGSPDEGRVVLSKLEERFPDDKLRLKKYERSAR